MIIKNAECKSLNSFGAFLTVNGELDVLCHIHEASYSRINHVDELFYLLRKNAIGVLALCAHRLPFK